MKPDDFADAIRGELSEMRVPPADDALLARIRMARAAGERVILPLSDTRRSRRPMFVVSAIVAAAVVVFAVGRTNTDVGDGLPRNESWLGGDVAYASAPQTRYAGALVTRPDRLRPMQVVYDRSFRDST